MKPGGAAYIQMREVTKVFKTASGSIPVLKNVSTAVHEGEFVSIIGRSGSGKSTLVNMVTGIDHPTSGTVTIGDLALHRLREGQISVWRGRNLGIVFQFFQLLPTLTLLENVLLPMDLAGYLSPARRLARAQELLNLVGLSGYADKVPAELSGGQQQSAAIARSMANDPPVIVADEPTGNLDSQAAENVFSIFTGLARQGKTILMVTHDQALARRAERTLVICDGELVHEAVSNTLPDLPHNLMLALSAGLSPWSGETLPAGPLLILVEQGELGVCVRDGERCIPCDVVPAGGVFSTLGIPAGLAGQLGLDIKGVTAWKVDDAALGSALSSSILLQNTLEKSMQAIGTRVAACAAALKRGWA